VPLIHFVLFNFLSCPPNVLWQEYLEEQFPAHTTDIDGKKRLNKTNTAKKFALDQTLGAAVNTLLFIAVMGAFKGKDGKAIIRDCQRVYFSACRESKKRRITNESCAGFLAARKIWPEALALGVSAQPYHGSCQ
jgi:hypothetical protein